MKKHLPKNCLTVALMILFLQLTACVPLVLTTATVTAINVSKDRRTAGVYFDDNVLEVRLRNAISKQPDIDHANISVTAMNNLVLLTGEVNTEEQRMRVSTVAKNIKSPGGQEINVVNELELAGRTNITSRINDTWITTKVKAKLLRIKGMSHAVKVVTEHGKVYLLGLVTRKEADLAVAAAGKVRGVTHIIKVFQYVKRL